MLFLHIVYITWNMAMPNVIYEAVWNHLCIQYNMNHSYKYGILLKVIVRYCKLYYTVYESRYETKDWYFFKCDAG
jgi:hypothetical protein